MKKKMLLIAYDCIDYFMPRQLPGDVRANSRKSHMSQTIDVLILSYPFIVITACKNYFTRKTNLYFHELKSWLAKQL